MKGSAVAAAILLLWPAVRPAADPRPAPAPSAPRLVLPPSLTLHAAVPNPNLTFDDSAPAVSMPLLDGTLRLAPLRAFGPAERDRGLVCYRAPDAAIVYRPTATGVKEDLVVAEAGFGTGAFAWTLETPDGVELRIDDDGSIGLYAPGDSLARVTVCDEASAALVARARARAEMTRLVARLPAPVAHDGAGREVATRFVLHPPFVSVVVDRPASWPLVIDPSVTLTTDADFRAAGNDEGLVRFSGNSVHRDATGAWHVPSWTSAGSFTTGRNAHGAVVHNNFVYVVGGSSGGGGFLNDVQFAVLNGDGSVGAFAATLSVPGAGRVAFGCAAYDGHLYVVGGQLSDSTVLADVQIARLNAGGTVATWSSGPTIPGGGRYYHACVAYRGWLYLLGGSTPSGVTTAALMAPIRADGSLGAWVSAGTLNGFHHNPGAAVHDGQILLAGGTNGSFTIPDVDFAKINADGTLSTWSSTSSLPSQRNGPRCAVVGGHLLSVGGELALTSVVAAPLLPGGGVGPWVATTPISPGRSQPGVVAADGRLYVLGGYDNSLNNQLNDVWSALPQAGHAATSFMTSTLPASRTEVESVAYNGRLYVIGGQGAGFQPEVFVASINADGTVGPFAATAPLPAGRSAARCAAFDGRLYVTGGRANASTYTNTVFIGTLNPDGTVASWATSGTTFSNPRAYHGTAAYNGRLYVISGFNGSTFGDTQVALINSDGTLGAWSTTGSLPAPRREAQFAIHGSRIYCLGGVASLTTTFVGAIATDGTVSWTTTADMPVGRHGGTAFAANGFIYALAGANATYTNTVAAGALNADGTVASWVLTTPVALARANISGAVANGYGYVIGGNGPGTSGNEVEGVRIGGGVGAFSTDPAVDAGRAGAGVAAHAGHLYALGGNTPGGFTASVRRAPIGPDGTPGSWVDETPLPTPRGYITAFARNGWLYAIGGRTGGAAFVNDVLRSPISTDGTLGAWTPAGPGFSTARGYHATAFWNGRLYLHGGWNSGPILGDVQFAPVNPDGTTGAWTTTTPLAFPLNEHAAAAANGHLYALGGDNAGVQSRVYVAPINADGTVGSWSESTALSSARDGLVAFARDGHLYAAGGRRTGASATEPCVVAAPILSGGAIGTWTPATSLSIPRFTPGATEHQGILYLVGGQDAGSTFVGSVEHAPLRTPSPRAVYSRLVDLGADATISTVTTNGGGSNGVATLDWRSATSASPAFGAATTVSPLTFGAAVPVGVTARWLFLRYTLDDTTSVALNADFLPHLQIDDITIVSTAPPAAPGPLAQFQSDAVTAIAVGAGSNSATVVLKATVSDPDAGDTVRLHVEVRPTGTPFTNVATASSALLPNGSLASVPVAGLVAGTAYHWQCWAEDNGGSLSSKVSFGGNLDPGDPDFFIDQPPSAPAAMGQFESDGVTAIPDGNNTTSSTVVFKATRNDPDALSTVKLQLELRPTAVGFSSPPVPAIDNVVFFETTFGAPGSSGSITVTGLALGGYHWQARTVDDTGLASAWTPFSGGDPNFTIISANTAPGVPASLAQFQNDGTTVIPPAGFAAAAPVKLQGTLADPDGDTVKLQVELRATGVPFTSPATPAIDNVVFFETALAAPATVQAAVTIPSDGSWHWQARAVDQFGAASAWLPLAGPVDFILDLVNDPPTAGSLDQLQSDGVTTIPVGGNATGLGVFFRAVVSDPNSGNTVKLQVELRDIGTPLGGSFTHESALLASGSTAAVASGALSNGSYHWSWRVVDNLGAASGWVSFGGNPDGVADFNVVTNSAPAASALAQFLADGITPLPTGNSTTSTTLVFQGVVTDPESSPTKIQIELQPVGTAFTNTMTAESGFVASGATATVSLPIPADGAWHWQARAVDNQGAIGAWLSFGSNPEADPDFRLDATDDPPAAPAFAGQYVPPGDTGLALGGSPVGRTVVIRALAAEPEATRVAFDVELRPVGVAFTGTATDSSPFGPPGTFNVFALADLADGGYHWQLRSRDESGNTSAWVSYGSNPESDADFAITATTAVPPSAPIGLQQKTSNDLALVGPGDTIAQAAIRLKALVVHPRTEIVKLQVEVKPLSVAFTGLPDKESGFVDSGSVADVLFAGFPNDDYHWQARTADSKGTISAWVSYGTGPETDADFSVDVPVNRAPNLPAAVEQVRADGIQVFAVGATLAQRVVNFIAYLSDLDGDNVRVEVELKPVGVAFDGTLAGSSAFVFSGSQVVVTVGAIPDGRYHWRIRATDAIGASSAWFAYGANAETSADFLVNGSTNVAPAAPASLSQLAGGTSSVEVGALAGPQAITFRSDADDADGDLLRLEVEVRPAGGAMASLATHSGPLVPSGFVADAVVDRFLFDVGQQWSARLVDANGNATAWQGYGGNAPGEADFTASNSIAGRADRVKCGLLGLEALLLALLLRRRRAT